MLHTFLEKFREFVNIICKAKKKVLRIFIRFLKMTILTIVILGVEAYRFIYENRKELMIGIIAGIVVNIITPYL